MIRFVERLANPGQESATRRALQRPAEEGEMDPALAAVLASLTTGIYVLTVAEGDNHHGMSSSWVTQVSGEPALLMAAVDVQHFSGQIIIRTGTFGLNLVGHRSKHLEDYFLSPASRRPDNLREVPYAASPTLGVPWLTAALGLDRGPSGQFGDCGRPPADNRRTGGSASQPRRSAADLDGPGLRVFGRTQRDCAGPFRLVTFRLVTIDRFGNCLVASASGA